MSKKVLILAESMRPYTDDWGSTQRVYNYSKELIKNGYDLFVICKNSSSLKAGCRCLDGINVISYDEPLPKTNSGKLGFRKKIICFFKKIPLIDWALRELYRFLYSEPNQFRGRESKRWAKKREEDIIRFIVDNKVDAVIISGPPFGLFYLAGRIKETGAKLILDYRDPWYFWYGRPSLALKFEKSSIMHADLIVASTKALSVALICKFKVNVIPILNGFNSELWASVKTKETSSDFFVISYTGYLLVNNPPKFRDPSTFIKASIEFLKRHNDVIVQIIGVGDDVESIKYKSERLVFKKSVPNDAALNYIVNSNLLVALHTAKDKSGFYIVCGKIYDYIRSGNRVLSIGDRALCNKELIEGTSCGIHVNNDFEIILRTMEREYQRWKDGVEDIRNETDITAFSRQHQNNIFISEINKLLGGDEND